MLNFVQLFLKKLKTSNEIVDIAKRTLQLEVEAIRGLIGNINDDFYAAVSLIYKSNGRVIVTGIGKSANIAKKIVATFNSTGTRSIFMHAADAVHGDIGMIQKDDIVICLSKSGETPEIKLLVPILKDAGNKMIAIVGNVDSYLAQNADHVLNSFVEKEACPNDLAPTSSTIAQLAMGDALAVCLLECREFSKEDFARFHPGGALGKKLYLRVSDIYIGNQKPMVELDTSLNDVIMEITSKRLGLTVVLNNGKIQGIITDGDLRRTLESNQSMEGLRAKDLLSANPKTLEKDELAINALAIMKQNKITQVIITDNDEYLGIVHIHDLIREGIL